MSIMCPDKGGVKATMLVTVKFSNERRAGEPAIDLPDDAEGDKVNNAPGNKDVVLLNC